MAADAVQIAATGRPRHRDAASGGGAEHDVRRAVGGRRRAGGAAACRPGLRAQWLLLRGGVRPRLRATRAARRRCRPPGTTPSRRSASSPPRRSTCGSCRTSGWRRTAIRSQTAKAFCTLDALSGRPRDPGRRRGPSGRRVRRARGRLRDGAASCSTRRSTSSPPRSARSTRSTTARLDGARRRPATATRAAAATAHLGRRQHAGGAQARRRRAATGGCRRGRSATDLPAQIADHPRAPPARARRRADRDRRQQPVAVRRAAVVRRRTQRTHRIAASEIAASLRELHAMGVAHCGVRFRSRTCDELVRPDRRLRARRDRRISPS